jgi:hypothetical protein
MRSRSARLRISKTAGAVNLRAPASAFRPASVILTRATSILRDTATKRSAVAVAIPERNQHLGGETVGAHHGFATSFHTAAGEQFERAAAVGLGITLAAALMAERRHGGGRLRVAPL